VIGDCGRHRLPLVVAPLFPVVLPLFVCPPVPVPGLPRPLQAARGTLTRVVSSKADFRRVVGVVPRGVCIVVFLREASRRSTAGAAHGCFITNDAAREGAGRT
jgi:hypothetical protein